MLAEPFRGANYLLRGFGVLNKPGIRRFVFIPLMINIILFAGLSIYGYFHFSDWLNAMLPDGWAWLRWILVPLFGLTILLLSYFTFAMVANILGAPFNGLLAEAVERNVTGNPPPDGGNMKQLLIKFLPMILAEIGKVLYIILLILPCLILFIIPVINAAAPFIWMALSAWLMAVQYVDYPLGNHEVSFKDLRRRLRERYPLSLGFGAAVVFATTIPIVNFFVMPAAVAGATLLAVERLGER